MAINKAIGKLTNRQTNINNNVFKNDCPTVFFEYSQIVEESFVVPIIPLTMMSPTIHVRNEKQIIIAMVSKVIL